VPTIPTVPTLAATGATAGEFGNALLYLAAGIGFVLSAYFVNRLIAPNRPNPEKLSTYECGEEPVGSAWVQFNPRFYSMGLVFLIFDVELLLLFPWVTVYADPALLAADPSWGWRAALEAGVFLAILLLGLVYVWRNGDIDWVRPQPTRPTVDVQVPKEAYAAFQASVAPDQTAEKVVERTRSVGRPQRRHTTNR